MNAQRTIIIKTRIAKPTREIASWKTRKDLSLDTIRAKDHIVIWRAEK